MVEFPSPVLVVDDSGVQRQYMADLCRTLGASEVLQARGGAEALEILSTERDRLRLVIVDLEMPDVDGVQVMQESLQLKLEVPIIVASSRESSLLASIETMCANLGVNLICALAKPLTVMQLTTAVSRIQPKSIAKKSIAEPEGHSFEPREFSEALMHHQFCAHFQPKVTLDSGTLKGVEVLIRWQHPRRGLVMPGHFIPAMEGTPFIHYVTFEVLDLTLAQMKDWLARGLVITASINLSASSLARPGFIDTLLERIKTSKVPPSLIICEITETAIMTDLGVSLGALARLRLHGVGLSIDDFGTGFSSMQQLSQAPFTELKIDRAFVHGAHERTHLRVMLESTIEMARRLNLNVVAEGVETAADWTLLRALSCEMAQGYHIARPMPSDTFLEWAQQTDRAHLA
ncbi:response regulator, CheY-like [gamma proteobacterium HdN1]|nr:response regulator, CheY-like [gamma proteobacterium HdN1]